MEFKRADYDFDAFRVEDVIGETAWMRGASAMGNQGSFRRGDDLRNASEISVGADAAAIFTVHPPHMIVRLGAGSDLMMSGHAEDTWGLQLGLGIAWVKIGKTKPIPKLYFECPNLGIALSESLFCYFRNERGEGVLSVRRGKIDANGVRVDTGKSLFAPENGRERIMAHPSYMKEMWSLMERGERWLTSDAPPRLNPTTDERVRRLMSTHLSKSW